MPEPVSAAIGEIVEYNNVLIINIDRSHEDLDQVLCEVRIICVPITHGFQIEANLISIVRGLFYLCLDDFGADPVLFRLQFCETVLCRRREDSGLDRSHDITDLLLGILQGFLHALDNRIFGLLFLDAKNPGDEIINDLICEDIMLRDADNRFLEL